MRRELLLSRTRSTPPIVKEEEEEEEEEEEAEEEEAEEEEGEEEEGEEDGGGDGVLTPPVLLLTLLLLLLLEGRGARPPVHPNPASPRWRAKWLGWATSRETSGPLNARKARCVFCAIVGGRIFIACARINDSL